MLNFYSILGVSNDASSFVIKRVYREKALLEHPDKGGDADKMTLLTKAYQTLIDPAKRKLFDEEWGIYNDSYETDILATSLGCLPSAGVEFSRSFRQQHEQFAVEYRHNPLAKNPALSHLKIYCCGLYSNEPTENVPRDIFSFYKTKMNLQTDSKLEVVPLTPRTAVRYFLRFLKGDFAGNELRDLSRVFFKELKQIEVVGQQNGYEFQLYSGIYELFLVVVKDKPPTAGILNSLLKITEFAKHNASESIRFMAPVFQSKYFRSLFSQALHSFWLSEEEVVNESYAQTFNGQAALDKIISDLKSKLSENRSSGKSNDQVIGALRQARLIFKLEEDLRKSPIQTVNKFEGKITEWLSWVSGRKTNLNKSETRITASNAKYYREKAFHLLDWLPAVLESAGQKTAVNTLLQIGATLLKAATEELNIALRIADEKILVKICLVAVGIAHRTTPDVELYACLHSIKYLLSCEYTDSEFKEILVALQSRAQWLADFFPFFEVPKSNAEFIAEENKTLLLMRQFLHSLTDQIDNEEEHNTTDHSIARILYQTFEACLKNWYEDNPDLELEETVRQRLMQELLKEKQWTIEDVNFNLNAPWSLADLDGQGWTCPLSTSPSVKERGTSYKTIHGFEINFKTGQISFILEHCEENEKDSNRLLTFSDLCELIVHGLTAAVFSLDPADSDMPYHPFNRLFFRPTTLFHSQLLHTMFITDYLLKFLTVGQEVQRRDPYDLRSLDNVTSHLPEHLKKAIYDFHSSHKGESINRFWIESEEVGLAIGDRSDDDTLLFAFDKNRMVVKHHRMKRDAEGKLVDTDGEDEGWDYYVLTPQQKQDLLTGRRTIKTSAIIIVKDVWELLVFENKRVTYISKDAMEEHELIRLSERERDDQEKIKATDSEAVRQMYRITMKVTEKASVPHRYSPEFIFAQEFTKYYDEYAIYFPEFGRLRELSKAVALVSVMANWREGNKTEMSLIRKRLAYTKLTTPSITDQQKYPDEYRYWSEINEKLRIRVKESIIAQIEDWRTKCSKEKVKQKKQELLTQIRQSMGTLKFKPFSPEVTQICNRLFDEIKNNVIAEYGYSGWNTVSHTVHSEAVEPKIPQIIADLERHKKEEYRKQLLELFADEFAQIHNSNVLINDFFEGNNEPLCQRLVSYERTKIAKQIQKIFPEHTTDSLDAALNEYSPSAIDRIVTVETKKAVEMHRKHLEEDLIGREKLEGSFVDLGFQADAKDIDLEGACSWVPASFRHDTKGGHIRAVYGGVSITGWIRQVKQYANPNEVAALLRQTTKRGITAAQNKVWGNAVANWYRENVVKKQYDSSKYEVKDPYYLKTPNGRRFWDTVVVERSTGKIVDVFENKTGKSRSPRQEKIDLWAYKNLDHMMNPVKLVKLHPDIRPRTWSF